MAFHKPGCWNTVALSIEWQRNRVSSGGGGAGVEEEGKME